MTKSTEVPIRSPFNSFFMGGFECATHRRRDRSRLDVTAATGHDVRCAEDYGLLREAGVCTVRDGLRWHLIEATPGTYEWDSLLPLLQAANVTGTQVIWDLCHWGVPDWLDIFSEDFPATFARFAEAAVRTILSHRTLPDGSFPDLFCAINEVSFWAWVGGDEEHFHPYGSGQGNDLKRQLVLASVEAIRAARSLRADLLFVQPEPLIHIAADPLYPEDIEPADDHTASQFEALDMLLGRRDPELGGDESAIDIVGVNYYWDNQWIFNGPRKPLGHYMHHPLHVMLQELWERYGRPILLTETGAESNAAAGWIGYICSEVRQAQRAGVQVVGICLYPAMDYPGWDDERHCHCGLIEVSEDWSSRALRSDLVEEVRMQQALFSTLTVS